MESLNLQYCYNFQKPRFEYFWNKNLPKKTNLKEIVVKNAIILPPKYSSKPFGDGCILDSNLNQVKESFMYWGDTISMGGQYEFDTKNLTFLDAEFLYLGFIQHHWGHMLLDYCTRLYAIKNHPHAKLLFVIYDAIKNFELIPSIKRFLELAEIDLNNIIFVNSPVKVASIIIPEMSYSQNGHYSDEYLELFETILKNIKPSKISPPPKVYFSRGNFINHTSGKIEIGNEIIDELFYRLNFVKVFPEQETLDNQIYYIKNANEYACIQGTLTHNLIFAKNNQIKAYIVNKHYFMGPQFFESCKLVNCEPIFLDFYTAKYPTPITKGPFIFTKNQNMINFIKDHNISSQSPVLSDSYTVELLKQYEYSFYRLKENFIINSYINYNPENHYYYPKEFLQNWLNNIIYKILPNKEMFYLYNSTEEIINALSYVQKLLSLIITNKNFDLLISYSTHISNFGWTNLTISGLISGHPYSKDFIEAIKIIPYKNDLHILYSVYYTDSGWTNYSYNGESSGSTGKGHKIHGIKITLNANSNYSIEYKIFTNSWSLWYKDGQELYAPKGMKAIQIRIIDINAAD